MAKQTGKSRSSRISDAVMPRGWAFSLVWAVVIVGLSIVASATINPLFRRAVHWDWMAGVAPVGFILVTLAFRRRWV
jgi:hypothetical protein